MRPVDHHEPDRSALVCACVDTWYRGMVPIPQSGHGGDGAGLHLLPEAFHLHHAGGLFLGVSFRGPRLEHRGKPAFRVLVFFWTLCPGLGWAVFGHHLEGQKPAFLEDLHSF